MRINFKGSQTPPSAAHDLMNNPRSEVLSRCCDCNGGYGLWVMGYGLWDDHVIILPIMSIPVKEAFIATKY